MKGQIGRPSGFPPERNRKACCPAVGFFPGDNTLFTSMLRDGPYDILLMLLSLFQYYYFIRTRTQ